MIKGISVGVYYPIESEKDRFGNTIITYPSGPVGTTGTEAVENVLVSPGPTNDLEASRPEGVSVALTLHFPKTFNKSLEGCNIEVPAPYAGMYHVVGDPKPYMDVNTPTNWHMPVEVEKAHG